MEKITHINKKGIKLIHVFLWAIYLAPLILIIDSSLSYICSIIIIGFSLIIWGSNKFYYIFPIFILFGDELLLPGDVSTYRVFSVLLFLKIIFSKSITIDRTMFIPFSIISLYSLLVISNYNYSLGYLVVFDIFLIILYISSFVRKNVKIFFTFYIFATVIACIYAWFMQVRSVKPYILINNEWVQVSRFVGTFPDPNYLGFFLNIAIFSIIILNIFNKKATKIVMLVFLYISLIATLSVTGFICNILILSIYFLVIKKVQIKFAFAVALVGSLLFLNLDFLANTNLPAISDAAKRINSQLSFGSDKDLSSMTTGRYTIWKEHLEYFVQQPVSKILFGGNYVTDAGLDPKFDHVSHQAYIDMLLNFGLLGTCFMLFYLFRITFQYIKHYIKTKSEEFLLFVTIKVVWMFYAFGLSMFPSWKFNLFFFL